MTYLFILVIFLVSFHRSTAQAIPHATLKPGLNQQYPSELRLMGDQRLVVCVQSQALSVIDLDGDSCVYSATLTDDRMMSSLSVGLYGVHAQHTDRVLYYTYVRD